MTGSLTFFPGFNPVSDKGMFDHDADLVINTVNCVGTSPKSRGIAGMVFSRFSSVHEMYMRACHNPDKTRRLRPGQVLPVEINPKTRQVEKGGGFWVVNAATKDHYRDPSKLEWVADIGAKLVRVAEKTGAKTMAIPPLGCGEGGLDWKTQVGPVLRPHLESLSKMGVNVLMFAEDPSPEKQDARTVPAAENRLTMRRDKPAATSADSASYARSSVPAVARRANVAPAQPVRVEAPHWYAGIGARPQSPRQPTGVPPAVAAKMVELGQAFAEKGWGLRSGGAAGSDEAFETGARRTSNPALHIYLPEPVFNGRRENGHEYLATFAPNVVEESVAMAQRLHRRGKNLDGFALAAMSRNSLQVLGPDLRSPSKAVVCYTEKGEVIGGTGHALKIAAETGIPVINLGAFRYRDMPVEKIVDIMEEIKEGRGLAATTKPMPMRRRAGLER